MVSSKHSRHRHAFRTPDVCKKKLPPGGEEPECNPDPEDILTSWYDVDVTFWIWNYTFSGQIVLEHWAPNNWKTPTDPPVNGEWGTFNHFPQLEIFSAGLQHWVAGVNVLTITITGAALPENCPFNTEQFDYTSPLWAGKKHGRIHNP